MLYSLTSFARTNAFADEIVLARPVEVTTYLEVSIIAPTMTSYRCIVALMHNAKW